MNTSVMNQVIARIKDIDGPTSRQVAVHSHNGNVYVYDSCYNEDSLDWKELDLISYLIVIGNEVVKSNGKYYPIGHCFE